MRVLVQKFGGTSVATAEQREVAVRLVERARAKGLAVVVVVSAMGRHGDPYATDTLLGLLSGEPAVTPAERDRLVAVGELVSAVILAGALRRHGLDPVVMSGAEAGIVTDDRHGEARILSVDPEPVLARLRAAQVPVVTGFQGATATGALTTLGRGGSDTTAAALGAALAAECVEIYTDVPGVMSADPRQVPAARVVAAADYEEVFQLASLGAKVIHPRAIAMAAQTRTPLLVRQLGEEEGSATRIGSSPDTPDLWQNRRPDASVVGVSVISDLMQLRVEGTPLTAESIRALFRCLANAAVSVDMINVFPEQVAVAIREEDWPAAEAALAGLPLRLNRREDAAKVSIVGWAIHGLPGVMSLVVETLVGAEVPIWATSDSHQSISCLVPAARATAAAQALHQAFGLGADHREEEHA